MPRSCTCSSFAPVFDPSSVDLPIVEVLPDIRQNLKTSGSLIIHAPPGAGKSTLVPLALLNEQWLIGQKILMLEPRRLAAKSIAARMAALLGEEVGETVGYRIRFEQRISQNTRIEVLTEGILTRMIHSDEGLDGVGIVIFDEFHERSIHADVAMALFRETQQVLRPELKMAIMSATLDIPRLKEMLQAPVVQSLGRQYPVEIFYTGQRDMQMVAELTARTIQTAVKKHDGDVLVFLPGQFEISRCEEILRKSLRNFRIYPLYGMLPYNKQAQAILPDREGRRKIVLSTSIAETSLTIQGIKIVIDSGLGRTSVFDPNSALSRLETVFISKDSADQRAGRAGRLSAGVCYRMWSRADHESMDDHRTPEIVDADLTSLVLDLAQWGITDPEQLSWLTAPPRGKVLQARELLHDLEALENGRITPHGKRMHGVPTHPRIAHMLLEAEKTNQLNLATDLAGILEERDPLPRESGIDVNLRLEALRRYRSENRKGGRMAKVEKVASAYRRLFNVGVDNSEVDPFESGFLLSFAFPERIANARPGNNAQFQLANGRLAMAGHKDDLAHEPWLAVASMDARQGMGKIFLASPIDPRDLASRVKTQETITWDTRQGGLIATSDLRIGNIVLKSTPLPTPDESLRVQAICNAIKKDGAQLLPFADVMGWQNRVMSLRKWHPEGGWPDVSTGILTLTCESWLTPYLETVRTPEDLRKLPLQSILQYSLSTAQQEELDNLAPAAITVPTGSQIGLEYAPDGSQPVLAVRLQEIFGWRQTPTVDGGKKAVLIHLLSPGYKPVQVTSDLESFWRDTYFEVRKELKRRYPRHAWPDDPLTAGPVRK